MQSRMYRMMAVAAAALMLGACSVKESFSSAAGPTADVIGGEYRAYAEAAGDARGVAQAEAFVQRVHAGEADLSLELWLDNDVDFVGTGGGPGVKNAYGGYLDMDLTLKSDHGRAVYGICQRSIGAMDHILRMHRPPIHDPPAR